MNADRTCPVALLHLRVARLLTAPLVRPPEPTPIRTRWLLSHFAPGHASSRSLGVNLYAKQVVDGGDRRQLERLCRYLLRPPIAEERLSLRRDGTLLLEFKKTWRDGTRAVVLSPRDLLVRLCAAIPLPYVNQVRYFGVLASAAASRDEVMPFSKPPEGRSSRPLRPVTSASLNQDLPNRFAAESSPRINA